MGYMLKVYLAEQRWPSLEEIGSHIGVTKGGLLPRMKRLLDQGRVSYDSRHHYRLPVLPSVCARCTRAAHALEENKHEMSPDAYLAILTALEGPK